MEHLRTAAGLLGLGAVPGLLVWWNMATGEASLNWALNSSREKNPIGFWVQQSLLGMLALILILCALGVLVGLLPG